MSHGIGPTGHVAQLSTDAVINNGCYWSPMSSMYVYPQLYCPHDVEAAAIAEVSRQLGALAPDARARVLAYLSARFSAG